MAVKKFCKDCRHLSVDPILKSMFNEVVQETFIVCPVESNQKISGCFIKELEVDWDNFVTYCSEKGLLIESKEE